MPPIKFSGKFFGGDFPIKKPSVSSRQGGLILYGHNKFIVTKVVIYFFFSQCCPQRMPKIVPSRNQRAAPMKYSSITISENVIYCFLFLRKEVDAELSAVGGVFLGIYLPPDLVGEQAIFH